MLVITRKKLDDLIEEAIKKSADKILSVHELDPDASYIFVLPADISPDESAAAFEPLRGKFNFVVVHADTMKVIEVK